MIQRYLAVLLFTGLLVISCSGSGSGLITTPSETPGDLTTGIQSTQSHANHHLWGYYTVEINPTDLSVEVVPLRNVQFTCNVTQFMQPPASPTNMINLAILPGTVPADGYFEVNVTLRHPFPGVQFYSGFDVRGILISNGNYYSQMDNDANYGGSGDTQLLNADGLTRWWNPTEFTSYETIFGYTRGKLGPDVFPDATLNGYKYFADALGEEDAVSDLPPESRGFFPTSPGAYTRPYHIQFNMDGDNVDMTFNYAVDASWSEPSPDGAPDYPVDSFPITANGAEVYCINVEDNGSTAFYEDDTSYGGELNLAITVYDWQASTNPSGVTGELKALWLESPVLTDPVDVLPTATVLPDGPTSSVYEVTLGSLNLTQSGDERLLVFAEANVDYGYTPQVSGGEFFTVPDKPLGAYLLSSVYISDEGGAAPIVTDIDPDTGQSGEIITGVIVTGDNFQNGAQVELRHDDWPAIEFTNEVVNSDTEIVCDLDLDLAAAGPWDVTVINPDMLEGSLEDGFVVTCADSVHSYEGSYLATGLSWNYCQRGDLTILETGPYAGECVMKRYYTSGSGNYPGYYVRFDPDDPADTPATDYFNVPGREDTISSYVTMTAQIDQNPVNGHIGVVNGRLFNKVQIVDENGTWIEDVTVANEPETYLDRYPVIPGLDFDADGDLWMVVDIRGEWHPAATPSKLDPIWQLRHYELNSSSPYYTEVMADRLDISSVLYDSGASPYGYMWYVADIAISYTTDELFILSSNIQGSNHSLFTKYDLSTSPPTHVTNVDLIDQISICSNPFSGSSRVDIEFDHTDLSAESCRLMVMYQNYSTQVDTHLMRLDTDLNVLADEIVGPTGGAWDVIHAITINTDEENRSIIAIDMNSAYPHNDFYYYTPPASGW